MSDAGPIRLTSERDPENLNWSDVDVVLGMHWSISHARSCIASLRKTVRKKVLISAPARGDGAVKTIVFGVNDQRPDGR